MKRSKPIAVAIVLIVLFGVSQALVWREQKYDYVNNYMFSYTTPRMRKLLSAGHEAFLSNFSMIRGIQFYGMNYSLFNKKPTMYEQFHNLADAATQLNPRFTQAYQFWGFAFSAAEKGKVDSYRFLMSGTDHLAATTEQVSRGFFEPAYPEYKAVQTPIWKIAKDAGYMSQYELKNATPEWSIAAYEKALLSPECPEYVPRMMALVKADLFPDPMIPLIDMLAAANDTKNEAIFELNLGHIQRLVAEEHKNFFDYAQQAYIEIHGASPTRIAQITKDISILKKAVDRYHENSREWNDEGRPQLFPNIYNPKVRYPEKIDVRLAKVPDLPIDPLGGEYLIVDIQGKPNLLGTGTFLQEREDILAGANAKLLAYFEENPGECPDDIPSFAEEVGWTEYIEADGLGYPMLLDRENCRFYFPPISEEDPPTLFAYGQEPVEEDSGPMELLDLDEDEEEEGGGEGEEEPSDTTQDSESAETKDEE